MAASPLLTAVSLLCQSSTALLQRPEAPPDPVQEAFPPRPPAWGTVSYRPGWGTVTTEPIDVVIIHLKEHLEIDLYLWKTTCVTLAHGNTVTVLTTARSYELPQELSNTTCLGRRLRVVDATPLETPQLYDFRKLYHRGRGRGVHGGPEPWERRNVERFFYLGEYMRRARLSSVIYIDSDVVLLDKMMRQTIVPIHCDWFASWGGPLLQSNEGPNDSRTYLWTLWVGTSLLDFETISAFLEFAPRMYAEPYNATLVTKMKRRGGVNDMTLWYLFTMTWDYHLRRYWDWDSLHLQIPEASSHNHTVCDSYKLGFDHILGHTRKGFVFDNITLTASGTSITKSIHFQGRSKTDIPRFCQCAQALRVCEKAEL